MQVLLDCDEVLADFVGGALMVHGWTRERLEAVWPAGTWSIIEPMGLTAEEFWQPINAMGEAFWTGLAPLPWAGKLIEVVQFFAPGNWYVVTSPSRSCGAYGGKARWLKNFLGETFDRIVITGHKQLLARPDTVLIDDREETLLEFERAGGWRGIFFPSRHNSFFHLTNPVSYVAGQLYHLLNPNGYIGANYALPLS